MREAGSTAVQEVAFTLADGIYVQAAVDAGLDVNKFAPRLSFFFACHNNFLEEIGKFRAAPVGGHAGALWRRSEPEGVMLRFHTQTGGSTRPRSSRRTTLCAPLLRRWRVLGGTQSLHTNSFDEALARDRGLGPDRIAHSADHRI